MTTLCTVYSDTRVIAEVRQTMENIRPTCRKAAIRELGIKATSSNGNKIKKLRHNIKSEFLVQTLALSQDLEPVCDHVVSICPGTSVQQLRVWSRFMRIGAQSLAVDWSQHIAHWRCNHLPQMWELVGAHLLILSARRSMCMVQDKG